MLERRWLSNRSLIGLRRRDLHPSRIDAEIDQYRAFISAVGRQIGELSPHESEDARDIRIKVRRAARTMGVQARTWIDEGKVYFYVRNDGESPR
jgi:hypothetical protein